MSSPDEVRQRYAEEIRDVLKVRFGIALSQNLVDAFRNLSREHFLGPGPWLIRGNKKNFRQRLTNWLSRRHATDDWTTTDPRHLYHHDTIVAIDAKRGLNNGQPSGLAAWIHFLELQKGDRVLHVGCGLGYYTAIIAEVVGPTGHVTGIEIDLDLASGACQNLSYLNHVKIVNGDGAEYSTGPMDAILINAGVTHPRLLWLDNLQQGGRMIIPLTTEKGRGLVLKLKRELEGYTAGFVLTTQVFDCVGSRNEELSERLHDGFKRRNWRSVKSLRLDAHESNRSCWFHGNEFCLSMLPLSENHN